MDAEQFRLLVTLLRAGGYREEPPGPDIAEIDAGVAADAACEACGHVGCTYRPFRLKSSYRAFVVCPACGAAEEF